MKELFESIPRRTVPARPTINLQPLKAGSIAFETDLSYGLAVVAYRLPGYGNPDFAAGTILADVLDSKRGNLYALVPEGKGALYQLSKEKYCPKRHTGMRLSLFLRQAMEQLLFA